MTAPEHAAKRPEVPRRVDAALCETIALLQLVRDEEQVVTRLRACLVELEAIRRARSLLAGRTGAEVVEAEQRLSVRTDDPTVGRWGS